MISICDRLHTDQNRIDLAQHPFLRISQLLFNASDMLPSANPKDFFSLICRLGRYVVNPQSEIVDLQIDERKSSQVQADREAQ